MEGQVDENLTGKEWRNPWVKRCREKLMRPQVTREKKKRKRNCHRGFERITTHCHRAIISAPDSRLRRVFTTIIKTTDGRFAPVQLLSLAMLLPVASSQSITLLTSATVLTQSVLMGNAGGGCRPSVGPCVWYCMVNITRLEMKMVSSRSVKGAAGWMRCSRTSAIVKTTIKLGTLQKRD